MHTLGYSLDAMLIYLEMYLSEQVRGGLHLGHLADQSDLQSVHFSEEGVTTIYRYRYSKDVHRIKCQALTIARLTHSPFTTKVARIRWGA